MKHAKHVKHSLVLVAFVATASLIIHSLFLSPAKADTDTANLIEDPGFESGLSNFTKNQSGTSVETTDINPISGLRSLKLNITSYGDSVLWAGRDISTFSNKRYTQFKGSARIFATRPSTSKIQFCGIITYLNIHDELKICASVSGATGDKGIVSLVFPVDRNLDVSRVRVGIFQEGSAQLTDVLVDDVSVVLTSVSMDPSPATTIVNGVCGSANNTTVSTAPTTNLCSTGTASTVSGSGPWTWNCAGANGGSTDNCSAQKTVVSNPTPTSTTPAPSSAKFSVGQRIQTTRSVYVRSEPRTSGTYLGKQVRGSLGTVVSGPTTANGYNWWKINYDKDADGYSIENHLVAYTVSTPPPTTPTPITPTAVNGVCGSANNTIVSTAPTSNLCSVGAASTVSGSGPWTWTCAGSNGGSNANCNAQKTVPVTSNPPPQTSSVKPLSASSPRILLNDSATLSRLQNALNAKTDASSRFKSFVDSELASPGRNYEFKSWHAALIYKLTGDEKYGKFARDKADAFVASEEAKINSGQAAVVAGDSYLHVGDDVGGIALTYDWANNLLTQDQKDRWIKYMNQALYNVWNPNQATWGGKSYPWSGWSLNDPFNNYYYSFIEATMLTGLATYGDNSQAPQWLNKFYNDKISTQLIPAFNKLTGGGSLEGTGYGASLRRLFKLYFWWEKSTGINIANQTPHTLATEFWTIHTIVPSLDKIIPTGDHSRDETAALYDYHRDLLQELISLYPNEPVSAIAKQLLSQSSVPKMTAGFNYWSDFINDWPSVSASSLSGLNTAYYGFGTGNFFSRSSWSTNAVMMQMIAGPYSQSHAHKDQGSFLLNSAGTWLFDDANRRAKSGIEQGVENHNMVRFSSGGSTIQQVESAPQSQVLALSDGSLFSYELVNTKPIYNGKAQVTKSERELLYIKPGVLVIFDRAGVNSASVSRAFQLQMSGTPTISGDKLTFVLNSQRADVWKLSPGTASWSTTGLYTGVRADLTDNSGTESLFLNVIGVNGQVATAISDNTATETGAKITFSDGSVATVRFSNSEHGGTLLLVNASGQTLYNNALPTTVTAPPLYK